MSSQAVQLSQGTMFRQGMPRRKRQILAKLSLFRAGEILLGNGNPGQGDKWGILFRPFPGCIIQGHPTLVCPLFLYLEDKTSPCATQFFLQLFP